MKRQNLLQKRVTKKKLKSSSCVFLFKSSSSFYSFLRDCFHSSIFYSSSDYSSVGKQKCNSKVSAVDRPENMNSVEASTSMGKDQASDASSQEEDLVNTKEFGY